jgi:uncharacterized membrane protein
MVKSSDLASASAFIKCPDGFDSYHAFWWTGKAGIIDIDSLGGCRTLARAVNDRGQVAGVSLFPGDIEWHGFSWTAKDGIVDIGSLRPEGIAVVAVNNRGQVVGQSINASDRAWHAFSSTAETGMTLT